jgi:hypothetical protein
MDPPLLLAISLAVLVPAALGTRTPCPQSLTEKPPFKISGEGKYPKTLLVRGQAAKSQKL